MWEIVCYIINMINFLTNIITSYILRKCKIFGSPSKQQGISVFLPRCPLAKAAKEYCYTLEWHGLASVKTTGIAIP